MTQASLVFDRTKPSLLREANLHVLIHGCQPNSCNESECGRDHFKGRSCIRPRLGLLASLESGEYERQRQEIPNGFSDYYIGLTKLLRLCMAYHRILHTCAFLRLEMAVAGQLVVRN